MPTRPAQFRESGIVRRLLPGAVQMRAAAEGANGAIPVQGTPILYDRWAEIYDWWFGSYMERIAPGAATRAISEDDVRLLINHDANLVLARSTNGSLRSTEALDGVHMEAEMAPTSYARDLAVSMERGDVSQMSFSFVVENEDWDSRPDGMWLRTITAIRLYDYSIVTYPAYEETEASLRARRGPSGQPDERMRAAAEALIRAAAAVLEAGPGELPAPTGPAQAVRAESERQAARHRQLAARFGRGG